MLDEFCRWIDSLIGTTIRDREVVDADAQLEGDGSCRIRCTLDAMRSRPAIDRLASGDCDNDEVVWHLDDVTHYSTAEQRWEYWDEFADRTSRGNREVDHGPQ